MGAGADNKNRTQDKEKAGKRCVSRLVLTSVVHTFGINLEGVNSMKNNIRKRRGIASVERGGDESLF